MISNPYGAVPEALNQTRLSLRDIMSDYLANKVAEGNLMIAQARTENDRSAIEANLEQSRAADTRDLARIAMSADQFNKSYGLQERETSLRETMEPQKLQLDQDRVKIMQAGEARAAREEARMNQVKTIGDWADQAGIHRGILDMNGLNPQMRVSRRDAETTLNNFRTQIQMHPSLGFIAHGYSLKSDLVDLQNKLSDKTLSKEDRAALQTTYDKKFQAFKNLDDFIMKEKQPDQARIADTARKTYADNPDLQTQFPNFESYLEAFNKDLQKTRGIFQNDIATFQANQAKMSKPAGFEQSLAGIQKSISEVSKDKNWNDRIAAGIGQRIQAGQYEDALSYAQGHLTQLQKRNGGNGSRPVTVVVPASTQKANRFGFGLSDIAGFASRAQAAQLR